MKHTRIIALLALSLLPAALLAEELKSLDLPRAIPEAADWLLAHRTLDVVKYAGVVTLVTQIVKAVVAAFGGKLAPRYTPGIVALVGSLTLVEQTVAKGSVGGSDWSALLVSVIATVAAFFGYKVLFSAKSRVQNAGTDA